MGVCCVDGCEPDDKEDVTYFPFPIKPTLRRKWREAIKPSTKIHDDSKVCSKHFNATDYERIRGKLRLKGRVVPTIFSNDTKNKEKSPSKSPPPKSPPDNKESEESTQGPIETSEGLSEELIVAPDIVRDLDSIDDGAEKCTIECVPEAILNHDTDSASETELEKTGDIEDIIANYHIKQNKKLAERLRADTESLNTVYHKEKDENNQVGQNGGLKDGGRSTMDDDCVEIEVKQTIEISVDKGTSRSGRNSPSDCLMVLENVQVDIDPSSLMLPEPDDESKKEDPISLLTSSDEDDVIIEEPHIDTVELSSDDEDDQPLVRLVKEKKPNKQQDLIRKILWGGNDYSCYECKFSTVSASEFREHKAQHDKIIYVCDLCNFTSASKATFSRHKRLHKMEKRYRCHLCDYKARHNMSLIYHMKSHEGITVDQIDFQSKFTVKNSYKCSDCRFQTESKKVMLRHVKQCSSNKEVNVYKCEFCTYSTKRRSDLKRHCARKHAEEAFDMDDDEDYVPK